MSLTYVSVFTDEGTLKVPNSSVLAAAVGPWDRLRPCAPRPIALNRRWRPGRQRRLYAVNAVPDASATVTSFLIDTATGALHPINRVTSAGAGPCYISLHADPG